jgi:hypothetical protein
MDPNTALKNLIEALQASNFHAAAQSVEALQGWHDGGGFLPGWPETVADPTGPGAWHLGRMVTAIDLQSRYGYEHALSGLGSLIRRQTEAEGAR